MDKQQLTELIIITTLKEIPKGYSKVGGFGEPRLQSYLKDYMLVEIPRDRLPSGKTPEVGQRLGMNRPDGGVSIVIITGVSDNTVTVDANHPLAGKDLIFEIELVEIN